MQTHQEHKYTNSTEGASDKNIAKHLKHQKYLPIHTELPDTDEVNEFIKKLFNG